MNEDRGDESINIIFRKAISSERKKKWGFAARLKGERLLADKPMLVSWLS